jgi:hypothetical protein
MEWRSWYSDWAVLLTAKELRFGFMTVIRDFFPFPKHPDQDKAHPVSSSVGTAGSAVGVE